MLIVNQTTRNAIIANCHILRSAFTSGKLGQTVMPEDAAPKMLHKSVSGLAFFTLPMSLNYQRDSYKLWEGACATWNDADTHDVFDLPVVSKMTVGTLQQKLMKYKVALQPNKHTATWQTLCITITRDFGSIQGLLTAANNDYLKLREIVQGSHKKGFPYLSGPKIFNYWCFIIMSYCGVALKNAQYIEIAPDTHVLQCSVKLGVLTSQEAASFSREQVSARWRETLEGSGITPIEMHAPLWFWSRNGFLYTLPNRGS